MEGVGVAGGEFFSLKEEHEQYRDYMGLGESEYS